jgi:hypothetical protein
MRDPRYRFSDEVRSVTRAIALRMIHAGTVADSPDGVRLWIEQTPDLKEKLVRGGYGSAFDADDLFPLFESFVAKARAAATIPVKRPGRPMWIALIVAAAVTLAVILLMVT